MSISDDVLDCVRLFRELQASLTESKTNGIADQEANLSLVTKVNNSFERFQLWSSNLGAHRRDKNSLDRRLWEASHLHSRVLEYLKDLRTALLDASAIIKGERVPWDELSTSSSEADDNDNEEDQTELEQLATYISNTISCLLRISMVIQKPAPHDRFINSGRFDQSFRQPWDEQHVRDKYPDAPEWLPERLGKAISRRRQFLEYRKTHHEQIASVEVSNVPEDTGTVVSSLPTVAKQDQGTQTFQEPNIPEPDSQLEDAISETSYAETIACENTLPFPKMPDAAQAGSMFECPFCFMIIGGIQNRSQWKRHVFTDLQPYICVHSECVSADETFARRHDWIEHQTQFHSKIWKCSLSCDQTYLSKSDMWKHIEEAHGLQVHSDAHFLALSIQVQHKPTEQLVCSLCQEKFSLLQRYYKHVARHLEQLALFAIPKDLCEDESVHDDDEDEDESNEDNNDVPSEGTDESQYELRRSRRRIERVVQQLGADHPHSMTIMDELASVYQDRGRFDAADDLHKEIIARRMRVLGPYHPETLTSLEKMATIYLNRCNYREAEELQVQVFEGRKKLLGEDHPDTLHSMANLVAAWRGQPRWTEALQLMKECVTRASRALGPEHPQTKQYSKQLDNWSAEFDLEQSEPAYGFE